MSNVDLAPHGFARFHCSNCGNIIDVPIHCSDKTCDVCTGIRRWRIRERIQHALSGMPVNQTLRWRHITLTVKNSHDLEDRLDHLIRSFRKLRHRKLWKRTQSGGFYVIEITEGVDGWHPHLHIVSYGHYIRLSVLSYIWRKITKDSHHVHLASIRNGSDIARYISKYITKASTLSSQSTATVNLVCRNRRLFGPFGQASELMKKFKPPKKIMPCATCGDHAWIPDIILEIMKRQAAVCT